MPAEVCGTSGPLPGISMSRPRDVDSMELMVARVRPPGTLGIGEEVGLSDCCRGRYRYYSRTRLCVGHCWNAYTLADLQVVWVNQSIEGGQSCPIYPVVGCNTTERLAIQDDMLFCTTCAS